MNPFKKIINFIFKNSRKKTNKVEVKQLRRLSSFNNVIFRPSREASDDLLKLGTIMIVEDGSLQKWVRFLCPCGCGQKRVISLQPKHSPHWTLKEKDGLVTIHPSVHVSSCDGCGAHFFIRNNKIDWV